MSSTEILNEIDRICSIYPTVGNAMYDEPRCRLALAIESQQADTIARLTAENIRLVEKLARTERALDAYACQFWNEEVLEHDPAQENDE